jgi:hypothetical protein
MPKDFVTSRRDITNNLRMTKQDAIPQQLFEDMGY